MKKILLLIFIVSSVSLSAQKKLFNLYADSAKLIAASDEITSSFFLKIRQVEVSYRQAPKAVLNMQSYLVFYEPDNNTIEMPLWAKLSPTVQSFFYKAVGGDEKAAKKIFGSFFNGFYIAQQLGNAVLFANEKGTTNKYRGDYFANTLAILFLRESVYKKQLDQCYSDVNSLMKILPDPVPAGEYAEDYYQKNYIKISKDPAAYLYFQCSQFKKIYEDKSLPVFERYLKNYLAR
jgi:hypothetical protein